MGLDLLTQLGLTIHQATGKVFAVEHGPVTTQLCVLPAIKGYQHKIVFKADAIPVRHKLRRPPVSVREVSTELQNLVEQGVIEHIDASEWVSPVVISHKKCGKIQLCVDLRGPNSQLVLEVHPLPMTAELHTKLHGVVFSQIDLKSAYHKLVFEKASHPITAFITHKGLFQFKKVPFGLASAAAAFQKLVDRLLAGIPGCQHYLDDIVCTGWTQKEHDECLRLVMKRLSDAQVTVNVEKSVFSKRERLISVGTEHREREFLHSILTSGLSWMHRLLPTLRN
ncbi:uncharacterized protein K02A2.6-like [Scylla paramamosain]|uniref:uncharacterized protein K02A2.6-like n=1 Tax=Scylla paramamosain TaxID=85552 RepID=UPI0030834C08